ncbi:TetR family transcriptional regulator, partial [Rhizobium johnstonii]|uniref:TetR family transcriptional regulator n=1 Tax=Rhizobium johnstonii TaxID=3019933 RepID=UPI003F950648
MNERITALVEQRRPKRADAARNYDALLVAANEVFNEQGLAASLEEIARRAGVGI